MTLSVHASVGMIIGKIIPNPILAFFCSFVSHFVLDMVPHGDSHLVKKGPRDRRAMRQAIAFIMVDSIATTALVAIILGHRLITPTPGIIWGLVGNLVPDVLAGIQELLPTRILRRYHGFHSWNHHVLIQRFFHGRDVRQRFAVVYQGAFLALIMFLHIL